MAPFREGGPIGGENPYTVHADLQQVMNDLVGIIRREGEIELALKKLDDLDVRASQVAVEGHRQFNPGWHLALDLQNMLLVSRCVAAAALLRTESRGGHTREDYPGMAPDWRRRLLVCSLDDSGLHIDNVQQPPVRADLLRLFDPTELAKYFTTAELAGLTDSPAVADGAPGPQGG